MDLNYTCISCGVAFYSSEIQRAHYKSDWHRYNLKRKVSELPPVTAENFTQRVLAYRTPQEDGGVKRNDEKGSTEYCQVCSKHFNNHNSYENHVKSRKHIEAAQNAPSGPPKKSQKDVKISMNKATMDVSEEDSDDEGWEDVEGEPLKLEECLFCSQMGLNFEDNIKHMTEEHSFFIPDVEYVVDLTGLITYLDEKVGVGNMCLWCNEKGKSFNSAKAAQQHMISKGHCKLLHEGDVLEEYSDYYDYSQSYPDQEHDSGEVSVDVLDDDSYQLVLPSGASIGHRSLMRYYRQNLRPVKLQTNRKMVHNVMSQYRALGWTGTTGEAAIRKAKDLSVMHMKRSRHYMQLGVKHNKLQKYFRRQNPM